MDKSLLDKEKNTAKKGKMEQLKQWINWVLIKNKRQKIEIKYAMDWFLSGQRKIQRLVPLENK
jgi:hypothetical protein